MNKVYIYFTSIYEAVRCLVKEKQKVKQGSVLLIIKVNNFGKQDWPFSFFISNLKQREIANKLPN